MGDGATLAGLDIRTFDTWLAHRSPELRGDGPISAELLTGGLSNLTYRIGGGIRPLVLRRPPLGHVLTTAHDMGREHRVLTALQGTRVPVPRTRLFQAADDPATGVDAPFYLMDHVDGDILDSPADNARYTAAELRTVSIELVEVLAELHALDPAQIGLDDFGRPDGFVERQLRRWATQYEGNRFRELPELDALLERLGERLPETRHTSIVHGDYRLDNVLVTRGATGPRIAAVLDWEMATLGDSLTDVGLLALYWDIAEIADETGAVVSAVDPAAGYPGFDELADAYSAARGIRMPELGWYRAFAALKLAIILEGIQLRHDQGETVGAGFDHVGELVAPLARAGTRFLEEVRS
jgi:aminoglycoside phosphotransferase (APT) family kinase protein